MYNDPEGWFISPQDGPENSGRSVGRGGTRLSDRRESIYLRRLNQHPCERCTEKKERSKDRKPALKLHHRGKL